MTDERSGPEEAADWPVDLRGVTESVVTTRGPNDRWNVAALGLYAPDDDGPVTATTWGRTRTRRNFTERGGGYVQFTRDPVTFVEAALTVREVDDPLLDDADAWARVEAASGASGRDGETEWTEWELRPVEAAVERATVPVTNRGFNAVVEATVAASRLDVEAYETSALLDRLRYFEGVVQACGGEREHRAFALLAEQVDAEW